MSARVYKKPNKWKGMGFGMDARRTFRIICYCGLISVLVDCDHVIAWAIRYLSKGETIYSTRFLHTPILIGSGVVFLYCCAYLGGLYLQYFLGRIDDKGSAG